MLKRIMEKLKKLRKAIDLTDVEIVKLLNRRADFAREIGEVKQTSSKNFYVPSREAEVYANVVRANKGPLSDEVLKDIYSEIISAARGLEAKLKIAFLGPEATFTHQAALKMFGQSAQFSASATPPEALNEVETGRANFAVVPVENSNEGVVNVTLDMLINTSLKVCNEIMLKIEHCLLSNAPLKNIKKIYSHPQALAQCRKWLSKHYPKALLLPAESTAQAVTMVVGKKDCAAIASAVAEKVYDVKIIARRIQDTENSFTRFFVIGGIWARPTGNDKTSVAFTLKDKVNALGSVLNVFARHNINLTKIQSRPTKQKLGEYVFFVDFDGHIDDKKVLSAVKDLGPLCTTFKILGSYPKGE
jgi:chorismate mutase/prephenate dehydratase